MSPLPPVSARENKTIVRKSGRVVNVAGQGDAFCLTPPPFDYSCRIKNNLERSEEGLATVMELKGPTGRHAVLEVVW